MSQAAEHHSKMRHKGGHQTSAIFSRRLAFRLKAPHDAELTTHNDLSGQFNASRYACHIHVSEDHDPRVALDMCCSTETISALCFVSRTQKLEALPSADHPERTLKGTRQCLKACKFLS